MLPSRTVVDLTTDGEDSAATLAAAQAAPSTASPITIDLVGRSSPASPTASHNSDDDAAVIVTGGRPASSRRPGVSSRTSEVHFLGEHRPRRRSSRGLARTIAGPATSTTDGGGRRWQSSGRLRTLQRDTSVHRRSGQTYVDSFLRFFFPLHQHHAPILHSHNSESSFVSEEDYEHSEAEDEDYGTDDADGTDDTDGTEYTADYTDDQSDFSLGHGHAEEDDYEALLALAERIGSVKPHGLARPALDALPTRTFHHNPRLEPSCCTICLCEFEQGSLLVHLKCDHHFHRECAKKWLAKNASCPVCRVVVCPFGPDNPISV